MSDLPYMPLYVAKYVGDTAHLTTLESGAYLALIFTYWMRQKPLPDDPVKLARIAKLSTDEWAAMAETLAELFQVGDGFWKHKRIESELARAKEKLLQATNAGRASAEARRHKTTTHAEPLVDARLTGVERSLNHKVRQGNLDLPPTPKGGEGEDFFQALIEAYPETGSVSPTKVQKAIAGLEEADRAIVLSGVSQYAVEFRKRPTTHPIALHRLIGEGVFRRYVRAPPAPAAGFRIKPDTPQWDAWTRHRGVSSFPIDSAGGWSVPSEWPPGHAPPADNVVQIGHARSA